MPATNTAIESALPAIVTRYVGICQICESEHKLTTDAFPSLGIFGEAHKVVHHGYRRPGHGSIEGDCAGVGEVPFEVSCEATRRYRGSVAAGRALQVLRLAALRDGEVTELVVRSWQRGAPVETIRVGDSMWPRELIALEEDARAQLAHLPEIAALVPRTASITCQVKRLRGERALAVLAANNEVERSQEDEDACPVDRATAEAALVDAYLAA